MGRILCYRLLVVWLLLAGVNRVFAVDFTLKGKVVDSDGNGIELASVACVEQGKVTMTNLKG